MNSVESHNGGLTRRSLMFIIPLIILVAGVRGLAAATIPSPRERPPKLLGEFMGSPIEHVLNNTIPELHRFCDKQLKSWNTALENWQWVIGASRSSAPGIFLSFVREEEGSFLDILRGMEEHIAAIHNLRLEVDNMSAEIESRIVSKDDKPLGYSFYLNTVNSTVWHSHLLNLESGELRERINELDEQYREYKLSYGD